MDLGGVGVTDWYQSVVVLSFSECVGHACVLVECASLTLALHVLVALHHIDHDCEELDVIL